jgi:hypothetical protein
LYIRKTAVERAYEREPLMPQRECTLHRLALGSRAANNGCLELSRQVPRVSNWVSAGRVGTVMCFGVGRQQVTDWPETAGDGGQTP